MKMFKTKLKPVSAEDVAAAARLSAIMARREVETLPSLLPCEPIEIEGRPRLFWNPAELSIESIGE